jgi:hypothetical protein
MNDMSTVSKSFIRNLDNHDILDLFMIYGHQENQVEFNENILTLLFDIKINHFNKYVGTIIKMEYIKHPVWKLKYLSTYIT